MKWFSFQLTFLLSLYFSQIICLEESENHEESIIYSTSVMSMVKILELEESLKTNLDVYVEEMQYKLDLIKVFQESIKRDKLETLEEKEEYMGNPLNSYPLLRRLNQDWPKWHRYLKLGISSKTTKEMETLLKSPPSDEDLKVALKGMTRIEQFYNQHAEDLTKGFLLGRKFESQLNSPDCVALGDFYYNQTQYSESTHWYRMALRLHKFSEGKIYDKVLHLKRKRIYKKYAKAMVQESLNLDKKKSIAQNFPELEVMAKQVVKEDNYENIKRVIDELLTGEEYIFQEEAARNKRKPSSLELGCRGKWPKPKPSPTLTCRYISETHDFLKLAPLKMEYLNIQPLIVLYHEVLYESEFKALRNFAIFNATMTDGWTYVDFDKTGKPLPQDRAVKSIRFQGTSLYSRGINSRIADMTGLNMEENMVLYLTNYGLGGHFGKHVDYVELAKRPPDFFKDFGGDRIATALLYASEVPLGGTTVFSKLKLSITPKKGNALVWFNLNNAGDPDPMSEHSVCPLVLGSRWTISKWIHERQQVFKKPCFA